MSRLILTVGLLLVIALAVSPAVAGSAPSPRACNHGTENAHAKIPAGVPGHEHVPNCDH